MKVSSDKMVQAAKESIGLVCWHCASHMIFIALQASKASKTIVKGVTCHVEPGQLLAILGTSGSGQSQLSVDFNGSLLC